MSCGHVEAIKKRTKDLPTTGPGLFHTITAKKPSYVLSFYWSNFLLWVLFLSRDYHFYKLLIFHPFVIGAVPNTESLARSFINPLLTMTIFWHSLCYQIHGNLHFDYSLIAKRRTPDRQQKSWKHREICSLMQEWVGKPMRRTCCEIVCLIKLSEKFAWLFFIAVQELKGSLASRGIRIGLLS